MTSWDLASRRKEILLFLVALICSGQFGLGPARADHAGELLERSPAVIDIGSVKCSLIPVTGDVPVGVSACPGVRPGASIDTANSEGGGRCTVNFLYSGSDGHRYAATAAHCVPGFYDLGIGTPPPFGDQVWAGFSGPEVRDAAGGPIGTFAYAFLGSAGQKPFDFALIRLNSYGVSVSDPQMCQFGGPTGLNPETTSEMTVLRHYGQGAGLGQTLSARTAFSAFGMPDPEHVFVQAIAVSGDSGSPITSKDGRAVGVITTLGFKANLSGPIEGGDVGILRLEHMVSRASSMLGISLTLLTAPMTPTL